MPLKLVKRHGSPFFYIRGTVRGISVDESTGIPLENRRAAETVRAKREWELTEQSIHGAKVTATYLQAAVLYFEAGGERRYQKRLVEYFGTTALSKIDQAAIDRAAQSLLPNASNATRNRQIHTPISAVLKHAAARGLCDYRPVKRPAPGKGRIRWISPEEADRLIEFGRHLRPLLIFLFYTGARISEALYLDWRQVDLSREQVQFLDTKNGESRGVPLHPRVLAALHAIPHRDGTVFRRPDGQPYERKSDGGGMIKTAFKGACRRAGIANFHPHDCRHTWASWHYAANRDLIALMELGGWKSEKMVRRYTHINVSHLTRSIDALPWFAPVQEREQAKADSR
jgi:integrase